MLLVQYGYIFLVLIFCCYFPRLKAWKIRKQKYQNSENISHIVLCPVR